MEVADALSRLPLSTSSGNDKPECLAVFDATPLTAKEVSSETKRDSFLKRVLSYVLLGWPEHCPEELRPFFIRRDELSAEQGCLTWSNRVIVPKTLQAHVLSLLHEAHPGMTRMKMLARAYVWWPSLDKDVEETVRKCQVCQSTRPAKSAGPLQPWRYPTKVWERIHADYAFKDGVNLLVLVDAYSKWIEVFIMTSTTTARTLGKLDTLFAAYGYPEEIVTDNGPQFTSDDFGEFIRRRGIKHTRTPPYHAASNGAAERLVRTTKEALLKQVLSDKNAGVKSTVQERLNKFLFSYRNTPHSITSRTPAEIFLKRLPRVTLSLLKPSFAGDMAKRLRRDTEQRNDQRGPGESFSVGDGVYVKTTRGEPVSWQEGTVEQVVSPVTYMVRIQDRLQFTHVDHLRPRRNSVWTEATNNATSLTCQDTNSGIGLGGSEVTRGLSQDVSSQDVCSRFPMRGSEVHGQASPRRDPTRATASEPAGSDDEQTPQVLSPRPPQYPPTLAGGGNPDLNKTGSTSTTDEPTPTGNQSSAPSLRRSTRLRNPPDRYSAEVFRKKRK